MTGKQHEGERRDAPAAGRDLGITSALLRARPDALALARSSALPPQPLVLPIRRPAELQQRQRSSWATSPLTLRGPTLLEQSMEPLAPGSVVVLAVPEPAPEHPDGGGGLVVAVIVGSHMHDERVWYNVHLTHSTPEMATDHDVVVRGATPWPCVIMGELYAQVWADQITKVVGHMEADAVKAAWDAVSTDGTSVEAWMSAHDGMRALPLAGPIDPRWAWLEGWLPVATAVSSPVRRELLD